VEWTTFSHPPKAGLHLKKDMFCVWWDWKRILYYELLPNNETINSEKYCSQLDELKTAIEQKRPEITNRKGVFHRDNVWPHVSLITRQKLLELGWDVLPQPPYSSDLAPSDFHLFRLQNSLNGKSFNSLVEVKNHLSFSLKNLRDSGRTEFSSCLKDGERL